MPTPSTLAAIVLTGGRSTRMGRDKAWLPFGPETLVERIVRIVRGEVSDVVLAAGRDQLLPASLSSLPVRRDVEGGGGPLAAFVAALPAVDAELVFLIACDMPLLQPCMMPTLAERCEGWDAAVPVMDGRRMPTCAVYRTDALTARAAAFGDSRNGSLRGFIAPLRVHELLPPILDECDPDLVSFTPCNTPEEYQHALERAGLTATGSLPPP